MTFSQQCKQEMARQKPEKQCCMVSELNALTQTCASLTLRGHGKMQAFFKVESALVAKRIFILLKKALEITAALKFSISPQFGGRRVSTLTLSEQDTHKLFLALHMLKPAPDGKEEIFCGIPRRALTRQCCQRAFLRGAFLGSGAITAPERDYHMEFSSLSESRAENLRRIMEKCGVEGKTMQRRGVTVTYVKDSEQIARLLGLMGATQALMQVENLLAQRALHNDLNRARNCDESNMNKRLAAAQKQVACINLISKHQALTSLDKPLEEIARLRLANQDASLEELGQMLSPPVGKSGVNHRIRKLCQIAEEIAKSTEKGQEK